MSVPCPVSYCDRPADRGRPCGACVAELRRALADAAWLAGELQVTLSRQHTRTGGGTADVEDDATPAVLHIGPLGYEPRASEAAWILRSTLVGWTRVMAENLVPAAGPVCAGCQHPSCWWIPYSQTEPADTCQSMAAWLSAGLQRLVRHPAASEACEEITAAVRAAERAVDRPGERVFAGRCECGAALYGRLGAAVVQCRERGCDAEPYEVRDQHERMREEIRDQLATATQAAHILTRLAAPLKASLVRKWGERHRLVSHGNDPYGHPLYRVSDVLELLVKKLERDEQLRVKREAAQGKEAAKDAA